MLRLLKTSTPIIFISSLLLTISCGGQIRKGEFCMRQDTTIESAVIVGELDWQSVTILESRDPIRVAANSVALLTIPSINKRCTGFLISDNILMTSSHCIANQEQAEEARAAFRFEDCVDKKNTEVYGCSTFLGNNEDLDYTLLYCTGSPGKQNGYLPLKAKASIKMGDDIYFVHQNCNTKEKADCYPSKKYSVGQIEGFSTSPVINQAGNWTKKKVKNLVYNADSLGGSSGSPLISMNTNQVIALHNMEYKSTTTNNRWLNKGVSMDEIIPDLKKRFPNLDIPSIR